MRNRFLSVILVLALCLSMLPAVSLTAAAETSSYGVWVGGVQVTDDNAADVLGNGTVSFTPAVAAEDDPNTSVLENAPTLTLSGASIIAATTPVDPEYNNTPVCGVYSRPALNLVLTGENTITAKTVTDSAGVKVDAMNLTISGGGSLKILGGDAGISAGNLAVNNATIAVSAGVAISLNTGCIITDSTVSAIGTVWGISSTTGTVKIDNSSVYVNGVTNSFHGTTDEVSVSLSGAAHVKAEGTIDTDLRVNSDGNGYLRNAADGTLALQPSGSLEYSGTYFEYVGEGHKGSSAELVDKHTHSYPCECAGMQVTVVTEKHNYQYAPPQDGGNNYFEEACSCGHSATAGVNVPSASYDGNPKEVTVTFSDNWTGEKNVSVEYFDANSDKPLDDPTDAGVYRFSVTVNGATYGDVGATFTIGKADATDEMKTASGETKYGSPGLVELRDLLPEGWVAGNITTTDADGVLRNDYPPSLDEHGLLTFDFVNDAGKIGKTATITVPVTSTNYNPYDIVVTVKALEKWRQTLFFNESTVTKTYGDEPFTLIAYPTAGGGDKTYSSSNPDVADIDPATGKVTIKKADAMPVTIAVTAAATEDYFEATANYSLKIKQKPLTVQPKAVTVKANAAVPSFELEYVGLVSGESLTPSVTPEFKLYESDGTTEIAAEEAVMTAGTYIIKWTNVNDIVFTGGYENNYALTANDTAELKVESSGGGSTNPPVVNPPVDEPDIPVETPEFKDVLADAYYADAVTWAVENGITQGTSEDNFSPNLPCTRAQAVTFLWRAAGSPTVAGTTGFSDVAEDAYYADAVKWAVANGITQGTGGGKFSPNATCNRAQIVTFLWRTAGSPVVEGETGFDDVSDSAYYADAVKWAVQNNITQGTTATTFSPDNDCVRAQIVTVLYRAYA